MPAIVPAIATFAGAMIGGAAIGTALAYAGLALASTLLMQALAPKPPSYEFQDPGYTINGRGSARPQAWIYGEFKIGGIIGFEEATGEDNKYFHRVILLAGHEVESIEAIYADDQEITLDGDGFANQGNFRRTDHHGFSSTFRKFLRVKIHLGSPDQEADEDLVAESAVWTTAHRLRGIAYLYVRFEFDRDAFPAGLPVITARIKGRKVHDLRNPTAAPAWSDNPALCMLDFLRHHPELNTALDEIDQADFITAANICDERVRIKRGVEESRYSFNGFFLLSAPPIDVLDFMRTGMAGMYWYGDGRHHIRAGAYVSPSMDLGDDDIRANLVVQTEVPARDRFNAVGGVFAGPDSQYQETDYPELSVEQYIEDDGGHKSRLDIRLPFTASPDMAQRIALIRLRQARQKISFSGEFSLRALALEPGDTFRFTHERFGWSNKVFEVVSTVLTDGPDCKVAMVCKETAPAVYAWDPDETYDFDDDNSSLSSPLSPPVVGIMLSSFLREVAGELHGLIRIEVTSATTLDRVEVQAKRSSDSAWTTVGSGPAGVFEWQITRDENHDVRARGVNLFGLQGPWTTREQYYADAFAAPPDDVENFQAQYLPPNLELTWSAVGSLDLSHYQVRYSPSASAGWGQGEVLVSRVARGQTSVVVPARDGRYMIRAFDHGGVPSDGTAFVAVANLDFVGYEVAETIQVDPFTGPGVTLVKTNLRAGVAVRDDQSDQFADPAAAYVQWGDYDFGVEVAAARVSVDMDFYRADIRTTSHFDEEPGLWDDRQGLWDGAADYDDVGVRAEVRLAATASALATASWQRLTSGVVSGRFMQVRALLETSRGEDVLVTPALTRFRIRIDLPDEVQSARGVAVPAAGLTVGFPKAFRIFGGVSVIAQDLASGDYMRVTNQSASGFTVQFLDGAGNGVARTADWVARGQGVAR